MFLKYNISNIKHERRLLNIVREEGGITVTVLDNDRQLNVTFTTKVPHKLSIGDRIFFTRGLSSVTTFIDLDDVIKNRNGEMIHVAKKIEYNGNVYSPGYYQVSDDKLKQLNEYEVDNMFRNYGFSWDDNVKVTYENFTDTTFSVILNKYKSVNINEFYTSNTESIAHTNGRVPFILNEGDTFNIRRKFINGEGNVDYEVISGCTYINENCFKTPYELQFEDQEYEMEDTRFFSSNNEMKNDVLVYEYMEMLNLSIPIIETNATGSSSDDIVQTFFEEKKRELIPDIIDYEKRCFTPFYKSNSTLNRVDGIQFNLYFRDRENSGEWTTNDALGWNQCPIDENGDFKIPATQYKGDLIGNLNFTDDDVYYRKKKISQSFLRLSFYDSNDPMNQMLLFYSTIFLDSAELYGKYIKKIEYKIANPSYSMVNDNSLGENRLSATFNVFDKYTRDKSSEGYYLYLFPDGLQNGAERKVYMKAEFNHAGYGITIPLMLPHNNTKVLSFKDKGFPFSFIDVNTGDLNKFYEQLYIPLNIKYSEDLKEYVYYFDFVEKTGDKLVFNLYEPKINPLN